MTSFRRHPHRHIQKLYRQTSTLNLAVECVFFLHFGCASLCRRFPSGFQWLVFCSESFTLLLLIFVHSGFNNTVKCKRLPPRALSHTPQARTSAKKNAAESIHENYLQLYKYIVVCFFCSSFWCTVTAVILCKVQTTHWIWNFSLVFFARRFSFGKILICK